MQGLGTGITRRIAQSPEMRQRVTKELTEITQDVHRRRIKEWANSDTGTFPSLARSRQIATQELAILCDALGPLAAITPAQFQYALWLNSPESKNQPKVDDVDFSWDYDILDDPSEWPFD